MPATRPPKITPPQDEALEHWLREEVVAGHQEYLADPASAVPADRVLERVMSRYRARQPKAQ